jgi:hypothetical protein
MPASSSFWKRVAIQIQAVIRRRTETAKVDWQGRAFKAYSPEYRKKRSDAGRSTTPNLSFTTRMLSSMKALSTKTRAIVRLSGQQGFKAWVNELSGRIFFAISKKEADRITKQVSDNVAKENKLKKR